MHAGCGVSASAELRQCFRVVAPAGARCDVCAHTYSEHSTVGPALNEQNMCAVDGCTCRRFDDSSEYEKRVARAEYERTHEPPIPARKRRRQRARQSDRKVTGRASPIERAFAKAWKEMGGARDLVEQHPVGSFRLDFAHIATRTAIELDGFASHSSTLDIEKDRKRQRAIEDAGWHVIRFGGREVRRDAMGCAREVLVRIERRERDGVRA